VHVCLFGYDADVCVSWVTHIIDHKYVQRRSNSISLVPCARLSPVTWAHTCTRTHARIHTHSCTGGKPLLALAIVCMPLDKLPQDKIAKILEGGQSVCSDAGIPIAGGHTIDGLECIYGLVVVGLVRLAYICKHACMNICMYEIRIHTCTCMPACI
jgi:hypothetical protein